MIELILIGAIAGLVMGTVGVGGGALIIFGLSVVTDFPQKIAQGTTLLIVAAPISLLAAWQYHRQGMVDVKAGLIVMAAFLIFSLVGALVAGHLPNHILKILLGLIFLFMGVRMILSGWSAFSNLHP
ncbi:MAG: TSUP family transporter [Acidobacteriota bacterium]